MEERISGGLGLGLGLGKGPVGELCELTEMFCILIVLADG